MKHNHNDQTEKINLFSQESSFKNNLNYFKHKNSLLIHK
jgi:hypothetical protein